MVLICGQEIELICGIRYGRMVGMAKGRKTVVVCARVRDEVKAVLVEAARERGVSVSVYIGDLICVALKGVRRRGAGDGDCCE